VLSLLDKLNGSSEHELCCTCWTSWTKVVLVNDKVDISRGY
jgi:hypothetical protein